MRKGRRFRDFDLRQLSLGREFVDRGRTNVLRVASGNAILFHIYGGRLLAAEM